MHLHCQTVSWICHILSRFPLKFLVCILSCHFYPRCRSSMELHRSDVSFSDVFVCWQPDITDCSSWLSCESLYTLYTLHYVTGRQYLRSAAQQKLIVPRCRRKTFGCRAFSVASPSVWNALPDSLRDPELTLDIFRRHSKTYFFTLY